jgi:hypothetical protein
MSEIRRRGKGTAMSTEGRLAPMSNDSTDLLTDHLRTVQGRCGVEEGMAPLRVPAHNRVGRSVS